MAKLWTLSCFRLYLQMSRLYQQPPVMTIAVHQWKQCYDMNLPCTTLKPCQENKFQCCKVECTFAPAGLDAIGSAVHVGSAVHAVHVDFAKRRGADGNNAIMA